MNPHLQANRESWDLRTPVHVASRTYDVDGFRKGRCTLQPVEVEETGAVDGRKLLHLQCHFGLDTLSWARRGAVVTGADFSEKAITYAEALARDLELPARFICCNLYDLPDHLDDAFDIVFTSSGVLCWLPDLEGWARIIARFLKPGGFFYIHEFHPAAYIFDDESEEIRLRYPYFPIRDPLYFKGEYTYTDGKLDRETETYEWTHSLSEIMTALLNAGLRIDFFHEFDSVCYPSHPFLEQDEDGLWRCPGLPGGLPLTFSMRATRPDS